MKANWFCLMVFVIYVMALFQFIIKRDKKKQFHFASLQGNRRRAFT